MQPDAGQNVVHVNVQKVVTAEWKTKESRYRKHMPVPYLILNAIANKTFFFQLM